jgi:hypothetical protein
MREFGSRSYAPSHTIAHHGYAGERCTAGFQSSICRRWVTIGKSHGEHNESGLPPIATDARTLRHFSGVPISQVDNSACQTARYRRLTRGDREAMSRLRAISTMPAGSNLTLMQGSWPLRADIASPLSVRHAISRPRRHSHRQRGQGRQPRGLRRDVETGRIEWE